MPGTVRGRTLPTVFPEYVKISVVVVGNFRRVDPSGHTPVGTPRRSTVFDYPTTISWPSVTSSCTLDELSGVGTCLRLYHTDPVKLVSQFFVRKFTGITISTVSLWVVLKREKPLIQEWVCSLTHCNFFCVGTHGHKPERRSWHYRVDPCLRNTYWWECHSF